MWEHQQGRARHFRYIGEPFRMLSGSASAESAVKRQASIERDDHHRRADDPGKPPKSLRRRPLAYEILQEGRWAIGRSGSATLSSADTGPSSSAGEFDRLEAVAAMLERSCGGDQRPRAGKRCCNLSGSDAAEVTEHAVADVNDGLPLHRRICLECQIALGVEAEKIDCSGLPIRSATRHHRRS